MNPLQEPSVSNAPAEKVALVLGAGDAIGSAIVRKFAQRGMTVCAARRDGSKLDPLDG